MQGLELIKELAELDGKLSARVEEARRDAAERIKSAEDGSKRLEAEAEAQIRRMEEGLRTQIAKETSRLQEETQALIEKEKERLRRQALPHIDRAVAFILSEVIP